MEDMMTNLEGIKIALCQMKVVPGRPDLNTAYIVDEIQEAVKRGVEIIVFPEMCTTGYLIGDKFEDEAFMHDVEYLNREIRKATKSGIVAIVGTPALVPKKSGEDGRARLANTGVVYADGRYVGHSTKTLQPNYRIFDDDRHFYSTRKRALELRRRPESLLEPFSVTLASGRKVRFGVILCEDMWWEGSYPLNPTKVLAEKGAEIVFNLSASPWTWQKNRKRHEIIKDLSQECHIPFVYVNNTGTQNIGKNIVIFDGCSTIYNRNGEIVDETPAYTDGTHDFTLKKDMPPLPQQAQDDTKELYLAVRCAGYEFFTALPTERKKVVIGMSGGIDSSLTATLYADILGPENVIGINMPSKFNSKETQELAKKCADNLGIASYEVRPVQGVVDAIASASGVSEGTLAYENVQARARMEILAARAQDLGCVFSANWNKVEASFGYGTLYGDMAGFIAIIGDLLKREVYQLADYMNRVVYKREVIPQECFEIAPTAELGPNQRDPFDYGNLTKRGYHEEMVRAFVEFRRNPEWFLELYRDELLEEELRLEQGRLKALFPNVRGFIHDLEKHWRMFNNAYFKRIQGPPIPIVSKRAFGTDLQESVMSVHFTRRYYELRAVVLSRDPARVVVYGGSFNPPALHHRQIVLELRKWFDEVVVVPCGIRDEKDSLKRILPTDRKEMTLLNFGDIPGVAIDIYDLENKVFTPTHTLDELYKERFKGKEVWHFVGGDLISGGRNNSSEIQLSWRKGEEIWRKLNFAVMVRSGFGLVLDDLPPSCEVIEVGDLLGSSTMVRDFINQGRVKEVKALLKPEVYEYIEKSGLYK